MKIYDEDEVPEWEEDEFPWETDVEGDDSDEADTGDDDDNF